MEGRGSELFFTEGNRIAPSLSVSELVRVDRTDYGSGAVEFTGINTDTGERISIKRIKKENDGYQNINTYFESARRLYSSPHQNVLPVDYATEAVDYILIATPFYDKGTLQQFEERSVSLETIMSYCMDFICGLDYIHSVGLIHGDVRLSNIVINPADEAVLADFGVAKYLEVFERDDNPYNEVYHPPDLTYATTITVQDDIYQVGVCLYRLFNQAVFLWMIENSNSMTEFRDEIQTGGIPNRALFLPHLPKRLRNIIRKCLNVDSKKRYRNCIDLLNDLCRVPLKTDIEFFFNRQTGDFRWIKQIENDEVRIILTVVKRKRIEVKRVSDVTTKKGKRKEKIQKKKFKTLNQAFDYVEDLLNTSASSNKKS